MIHKLLNNVYNKVKFLSGKSRYDNERSGFIHKVLD